MVHFCIQWSRPSRHYQQDIYERKKSTRIFPIAQKVQLNRNKRAGEVADLIIAYPSASFKKTFLDSVTVLDLVGSDIGN